MFWFGRGVGGVNFHLERSPGMRRCRVFKFWSQLVRCYLLKKNPPRFGILHPTQWKRLLDFVWIWYVQVRYSESWAIRICLKFLLCPGLFCMNQLFFNKRETCVRVKTTNQDTEEKHWFGICVSIYVISTSLSYVTVNLILMVQQIININFKQ